MRLEYTFYCDYCDEYDQDEEVIELHELVCFNNPEREIIEDDKQDTIRPHERVGEQSYTTYEYSINKKLDIKLDLGPINISPEVEKKLEENSSKIKEELIKTMRKQNKTSF